MCVDTFYFYLDESTFNYSYVFDVRMRAMVWWKSLNLLIEQGRQFYKTLAQFYSEFKSVKNSFIQLRLYSSRVHVNQISDRCKSQRNLPITQNLQVLMRLYKKKIKSSKETFKSSEIVQKIIFNSYRGFMKKIKNNCRS